MSGLLSSCRASLADLLSNLGNALAAETRHLHDVDDPPAVQRDRVLYRLIQQKQTAEALKKVEKL